MSVTPLALATMIATVANGGTLVTPHLARAFDAGDGRGWQPFHAASAAIAAVDLTAIICRPCATACGWS